MITNLAICDLCRQEGEVALAVLAYQGASGQTYHACQACLRDVEAAGVDVVQTFDTPGNPEPGFEY